ncbi:hypothetical protein [Pseudoduganella aquatica]|uniref:hypothetical protein n=1 Tax=Pseudoduganella aquatica TaxID=2660641 RepID=UPI001E590D0D|nr:hypothetical protein [Pseudoduganella aquatica]
MTKQSPPGKAAATPTEPTTTEASDAQSSAQFQAPPPIWLLKTAKASKVSKYAEGSIEYQVIADVDRTTLLIAITGNQGGGYFSRERVPFPKIEACVSKCDVSTPFPSRALKDAFVGRSSNNAGFIVAILRSEGLLGPAPDAETQHIITGDWAAWKKTMLAEAGTLIEPVDPAASTQSPPEAEHSKTPKQNTAKKA